MTSDTRLVWLTPQQVAMLSHLASDAGGDEEFAVREIISAWDAAPADATEAAYLAMEHYMATTEPQDDSEIPQLCDAVLRALGMPDPQPETT